MCTRSAYSVLHIEIEEPSPIYDRDTKNKADSLTDCMLL